jgi:serine/threonine-protein kinase
VIGLPQKEAEQQLKDAGFKVATQKQFSDSVKNGRVIDTTPAVGTLIERGTTVTMTVSQGKQQVSVPDVTGETEDNARSAIEGAGLRVGKITQQESSEDPGTVIEQSPAGGQQRAKGSAVDLTVAKAVEVPDVVDRKQDAATKRLEDAGFSVKVRKTTTTDQSKDGVVLDQSPQGGEQRRQGSTVTITVGRLEATPTPTPSPTATPTPTPTVP